MMIVYVQMANQQLQPNLFKSAIRDPEESWNNILKVSDCIEAPSELY